MNIRDKIEIILLRNFKDLIKPISENNISTINNYKDGSFGFSYLGLMLYANGCNIKCKSTLYPQGLLYHDGNTIFGLGFFKKDSNESNCYLHIIAPRGKDWISTLNKFISKYRTIDGIPKTPIYIRHLDEKQYFELNKIGYLPISEAPWNPIAPSEDETYNNRIIKIDDILDNDHKGNIKVKILDTNESKNFRKKSKSAYNRFNNFINRNNLNYKLINYDPIIHKSIAKNIVIKHFNSLEEHVGSTPQDYYNLINYIPSNYDNNFVAYLGLLYSKNINTYVSFFMGEKIDENTIALYATFALRNKDTIKNNLDIAGFTAISQYTYIRIFNLIKKLGYKYVDVGGSEVEDLNRFKRQLGATVRNTYWVVKK